jgi:hypothetical protein
MDDALRTLASLLGLLAVCLLSVAPAAGAADAPLPALPEGNTGISARHPGDVGIERDPAVIFHEDFEDCRGTADLSRKWDAMWGREHLRIAEDPANVNSGRRAVEMTIPKQDTFLSVNIGRTLPVTREALFLRFYTKFEKGYDHHRTGSHNMASISAGYFPGGQATPGVRADGRNKFLANLETNTSAPGDLPSLGPLYIYIYHPEQRDRYGDDFYPNGMIGLNPGVPGNFGPHFVPRANFIPETDRWYCFEYMLQANTPGQRDGRIAYWVDGKLAADFPNLRLRDVDTLKIDRFDIGLYIAKNAWRENKKWWDDIVAATSYIGPRVPTGPT